MNLVLGEPPTGLDPVEFRARHLAQGLDVLSELLLGLIPERWQGFERELARDFQLD
jgi:hypothetical protein